ncbi:DUF4190 domain-containing protein [Aeromicrobium sp. 9AM]|uniref:DUF4190 domain-containing protein n=1 Tax=Aeromicrobium sp. 9AM TaxID=2653126 RepID=UPI0012F46E9B|nr:DUF4190 domain-containing protein [Aeromicrobium sp. 9AM]VXC00411.1 conserved hypothetical protein [Aeromicrobium sp. 9AM]
MNDDGADLRTNRKAIYSVIFGAAAFPFTFFGDFFFFAFMLGVPSVTCGIYARREIRDSKGTEDGDTTAIIGITIGATTVGLVILGYSHLLPG